MSAASFIPGPGELALADAILERHADAVAGDARAYRGHVYRVYSFARVLGWRDSDALLQIAAAAHDLSVWTCGELDYLDSSAELADEEARHAGLPPPETASLRGMVLNHHKVLPAPRGERAVEIFRRADWIDVTRGRLRFGLSPLIVAEIRSAHPDVVGDALRLAEKLLRPADRSLERLQRRVG